MQKKIKKNPLTACGLKVKKAYKVQKRHLTLNHTRNNVLQINIHYIYVHTYVQYYKLVPINARKKKLQLFSLRGTYKPGGRWNEITTHICNIVSGF